MLELLRQKGLMPGVEAVGGLTLGADPVATAMMHASAADAASGTASAASRPLDAFVVRKANKAHGLQRRIEGPDVAGRRVVAVEDTSTTGGSVLTACEALSEAGAEIAAVEIGRASCRERGWRSGGGGAGKEKQKRTARA